MITRGFGTNTIITRGMAETRISLIRREISRSPSWLVVKINLKSLIDK